MIWTDLGSRKRNPDDWIQWTTIMWEWPDRTFWCSSETQGW